MGTPRVRWNEEEDNVLVACLEYELDRHPTSNGTPRKTVSLRGWARMTKRWSNIMGYTRSRESLAKRVARLRKMRASRQHKRLLGEDFSVLDRGKRGYNQIVWSKYEDDALVLCVSEYRKEQPLTPTGELPRNIPKAGWDKIRADFLELTGKERSRSSMTHRMYLIGQSRGSSDERMSYLDPVTVREPEPPKPEPKARVRVGDSMRTYRVTIVAHVTTDLPESPDLWDFNELLRQVGGQGLVDVSCSELTVEDRLKHILDGSESLSMDSEEDRESLLRKLMTVMEDK